MERLNVTAVTMGDEKTVNQWKADAPGRIIPGTAFERASLTGPKKPAELKRLREAFTAGGFKVMGEVGLQYEGLSPSDPAVEEYFALAESWIFRSVFTWVRAVRAARTFRLRISAALWETRCCSKNYSRGIRNSAFG